MNKKKDSKSSNYLVFARKFRPQIFDEIKGQDAVVATLKNAVSQNRVPQSFLFTGTRGVGKTSAARILAKSLNCEKGPTVKPCGVCTSCAEITSGSSLDVIEIDGASNNSVDNIRDLRESIAMSPVHGRFKIYIIDEVHMLSQGAFNALLKTLEEPPPHAKFVFATTDAHKVPATILSRCQKFQFRRIPLQQIIDKLRKIADSEKIKADPEALTLIAKASDGSMRDGESLLDQLASFSEGKIKTENVEKTLGVASVSLYLSLLEAWGKKDACQALKILEAALDQGLEIVPFTKGLYEMVRHFLIVKVHPKPKGLIDLAPDTIEEIKKGAQPFTEDGLLAISAGLEKLIQTVQYSPSARFALEAAVIRMASVSDIASLSELVKRMERLEKKTPAEPPRYPSNRSSSSGPAISQPSAEKAPLNSQKSKGSFFALEQVEAVWPKIILDIEKEKMSLAPALTEAEPIETEDGVLILGFPKEFIFHKETLEQPEIKSLIEKAFEARLGAPVRIRFVITAPNTEEQAAQKTNQDVDENEIPPIVESALDIFKSGRIIRKD